ncbi:MAG: response regulator [Gemmatimonadales bacterium]|nr:MAG: response regulator [Gemmatimonadales bacterium]
MDAVANGDDALDLLRGQPYDLILLDEQMPGLRGLEVLEILRREDPHARVVMITKSEEDRTMTEAIGRRVDDYLVKPASPLQVLSAVTRILEGSSIRQQQVAQDFATRFRELGRLREEAVTAGDFQGLYSELVDWHLRLEEAGEAGLLDSVESLLAELRSDFGPFVAENYPVWMRDREDSPLLSPDLVSQFVVPRLEDGPVLLVVVDCMRLDQWRVLLPLLVPRFEVQEALHWSILPTATPWSRNAIFGGLFPDEIEEFRPGWFDGIEDEGSLNAFEDELLEAQLRREMGRDVPIHYEKVTSDPDGARLRARVRGALGQGAEVVALVFNFMDQLIHSRSESRIFMEIARDERSLRDLTLSWFEHSALWTLLQAASAEGLPVVLTTDHGSILCRRPTTVYARRDATSNLRYKFGQDLKAEDPKTVFRTTDPEDLRLPPGRLGTSYVVALEDHYMVYPTKLREYQARYRDAFLHGGISPEEVIVPVALLTPRPR